MFFIYQVPNIPSPTTGNVKFSALPRFKQLYTQKNPSHGRAKSTLITHIYINLRACISHYKSYPGLIFLSQLSSPSPSFDLGNNPSQSKAIIFLLSSKAIYTVYNHFINQDQLACQLCLAGNNEHHIVSKTLY